MKLSYRARRTWHRVGIAALAIAVLAALMIFVWTVWLGRYVVYTRDGATLDFNSSAEMIDGVVAQEPPTQETVSVVYQRRRGRHRHRLGNDPAERLLHQRL